MLKEPGKVVLLLCKLEALNFFKTSFYEHPVEELSLLYKRVKSPEILPVLKYLPYPKLMFPSNYLLFSFSPALYCSKHKQNACLKL